MPELQPAAPTPSRQEPAPVARSIRELSAVMPAYNEADVLPVSLEESVAALGEICERWELVVVDDGSTDTTPEIIEEWSARDERVRAATQPRNLGYSKALIRGFGEARYSTIFYTDADAQFDLREIERLFPHLADYDMVVGYRRHRRDPWMRLLTSAVFNRTQALALGVQVRDCNCAFKLFRRSFFDSVQLRSDGYLIDAELFARARAAGLRWTELPVTHRPRTLGSSKIAVRTVFDTLRELRDLRRAMQQP